jgi:hypothetical protein
MSPMMPPARGVDLMQIKCTFLKVCFDPDTNTCGLRSVCRLQRLLGDAMKAFYASLDGYSLEDLRLPAARLEAALHWHPRSHA